MVLVVLDDGQCGDVGWESNDGGCGRMVVAEQ